MAAYLWPLVSCCFYTAIIRQKKKDFEKSKKSKRYSQKIFFTLGLCNKSFVCLHVDYIFIFLWVVLYVIVFLCVYDDTSERQIWVCLIN